ncbi:hypothetical protein O181_078817 [Austropuccinia psidii MF-1]|uniref:ER membrane protein complex subunit 4 n=1 Tax=Austropuccinia psidii MF-1 TaxID=1389203 RepID=A0A9Q3FKY7_9BASI|nr:hypothetical protein [Austropuccinia psidii MF-1]
MTHTSPSSSPRPSRCSFHVDLRSRPSLEFQVPDPPLFSYGQASSKNIKQHASSNQTIAKTNEAELHQLRQKKAWELALAPAKQVPMQAFMIWMSGSGVQIFSVMMVYMLIKGAITASLSVNTAFQPFEPPTSASNYKKSPIYRLTFQKLAYVGCQCMLLALGLWKVDGMGLLPTRMSDWIMYELKPSWALKSTENSFTTYIP